MKTLIVEDDMMSQCLLAQVLTERGHEVVTYENAEQAILAYQKQFFPLLFVDVGLPGMNGLQFCKWVRSQSQGEKAFIMVATSSGEPADVSEVLAVGANDFLSKPYDVGTLNVRLSIAEGQMKEFFERQELEDSLRQRREAFDRLVHTAHEGVWLLDAQFHADYVNPQMAEILGYQVEELIHRAVIDFVAEPAQREAEQMFAEQKEGRPIQRELRFRRKDRSECLTFLSATPVRTANGEFEGSLWMVADLTQRTTLESDLAETRKRFETQVRDLTGELNQAAQSLQAETAEREKVRQTLQHTRADLEKLSRERAAEFAQKTDELTAETANRQRIEAQLARTAEELKNEIAEHKRAEQELAKAREELARRLKDHGAELLKLDQELKAEQAGRRRAEGELLQTREETAYRVKEHMAEMLKAGDELKALLAERKKAEESFSRERGEAALKFNEQARELAGVREQWKAEAAERQKREQAWSTMRGELEAQLKERNAERARLEEQLRQRAEQLAKNRDELRAATAAHERAEACSAAFSKLGRDLGAARTPQDVARISAGVAQDLLRWDAYSCNLYSSEENRIHPVLNIETLNGRPADVPPTYGGPGPSPIMQRVLKDGPQLNLRSGLSSSHTDFILFGDRARLSASLMDVAIRAGGKVVGFLAAQSYAPDAYGQEDLETLQALADHCGGALQRIRAQETQSRGEQRFQLVARATNDVVWDWNLETNQLWWNEALQTLLGYKSEEIEPGVESRYNRIHPDEKQRVVNGAEAFIKSGGESWSDEYRFRRHDGSYAHVLDRGYVVRDESGKPVRMIGAMMDISERRQVEAAKIGGQAHQGAILEAAPDAVVTIDHEGKIFEWNPAAEKMFGYTRADVLGKDLAELIIPTRLQEQHRAGLKNFLNAGAGPGAIVDRRVELKAKRASGAEFLIEMAVTRLAAEGAPLFAGFIRDITERKRTEMEIQKLAAFPRWNPNPVFEFSADGALTYFNDAAQGLASSLGRDHPSAILPSDTADIVKECLMKGQNRVRFESTVAGQTVAWTFVPVASSQVVHGYARDATERLAQEAQLWQAQKMESIGQLAAGVAHDFNNLLSVVQGYSTVLMEDQELKPETTEALKQISSATERATHLTRQLLTLSRKQVIQVHPLDLHEVINNASKMVRRAIGESIALQFNYSPGLPAIEADPGMMEQVILDLATNAREAMPEGGQLTIGTKAVEVDDTWLRHNPEARRGRFVCLSVTDTGSGMDEATLARIFEPFFTTKSGGKGTGLGLATVYGIIKQHQGWIEAHSQVGHGTTFNVFLPVSSKTPAATTSKGSRPVARGGTETILLVEDEPAVLMMAKGILQRLGYRVIAAPSGDEAVPLWREEAARIDLLLTDMVMPGSLNGRELAEQLLQEKPGLKVLYTSGYSLELIGSSLTASKNFIFLPKPYHPDTLAQTVRKCLDRETD